MRNTQNAFFNCRRIGESPSSGVQIPDIKKISELFEINYGRADRKDKLRELLIRFKEQPGPHLVEVIAHSEQEIIPTVKSRKLKDGKMESGKLHPMYPFG